MKAFSDSTGGKITWAQNSVSDDEVKVFRAEMAVAKQKWTKLRKENKKKAENKDK